jgi:hypothetical protein
MKDTDEFRVAAHRRRNRCLGLDAQALDATGTVTATLAPPRRELTERANFRESRGVDINVVPPGAGRVRTGGEKRQQHGQRHPGDPLPRDISLSGMGQSDIGNRTFAITVRSTQG